MITSKIIQPIRLPLFGRATSGETLSTGAGNMRPSGRNVAFFGDSRTIQGLSSLSRYGVRSYPYWARLYASQRFDTTSALNFGVGGNTTAQMLARVDAAISAMIAASVGTVVFLGGTNDVISIADSQSNISQIVQKFRDAGLVTVIITETPRTPTVPLHLQIRDYLRTLHDPKTGVYTVDVWSVLAGGDSAALPGVTVDGVHLTVYGCRILGQAVSATIRQLIVSRDILPTVSENVTLIGRNLLANAMLGGTGGSKTNVTGDVADNFAANNGTTGCTVVAAKVVREGYEWQQLTISGTPTAAAPFVRFEQNVDAKIAAMLALGGLKAGDTVDGGACIFASAPAGVKAVRITIVFSASANAADGEQDTGGSDAGFRLDSGQFEGPSRIIPQALSADATLARLRIEVLGTQNVEMAGVFQFSRPFLMSVT